MRNVFLFFIVLSAFFGSFRHKTELKAVEIDHSEKPTGAYLGQLPPDDNPRLFAPGLVSTGFHERCAWFSPDGKEFYFSMYGAPAAVILCMKKKKEFWSKPRITSFSYLSGGEFTMSPDGNRIFFISRRPVNEGKKKLEAETSLWVTEREGDKWGEPRLMDKPFCDVGYLSVAGSGNYYFFSYDLDGYGKGDIYMSEYKNGKYGKPLNLGPNINSRHYDVDPYITPDESYLIFSSNRSPGGLYISYKTEAGEWLPAKYMGDKINKNTGDGPICPSVSPDRKYLFFTCNRKTGFNIFDSKITLNKKINILNSPGNGQNDIYWVSADIIEKLGPKNLD